MENNNYQLQTNILPTEVKILPTEFPDKITKTLDGITKIEKAQKEAEDKAKKAKESADIAKTKSARWSLTGNNKKEAIEALQTTAVVHAIALSQTIDASKELFNNQKDISQAIRYLFALGATDITANRMVVRELQMRLQNASQEELSDFARQELENVICQLRAQEDMQERINGHDELLRNHKLDIETAHTDIDKIRSSINKFEQSCQQTINHAEQMLSSVEELKGNVSESLDKLEERFAHLEYNLDHKIDSKVSELETQIISCVEKEVIKAMQTVNIRIDELFKRIDLLQEEINKKTIFDTKAYKVAISLIAILSLVLHFL
ncbi:hypothetical protein [Prevotella falsenii]|uniref:hypothetical protein n=1 Tax=Prevotella falsenii TaxID=515414 RepID=UPI000468DB2D|nr:hypothetical protein [Prevotella falsenii]